MLIGEYVDRIYVLDRVEQRHPGVSKEDAAHAWEHCIRSMPRLLEVVAIRNENGDWLIKHAQTPPQERVKRELGFGRRGK